MTRGGDLRATVRDGKRLRTTNLDLRVAVATGAVSRIGFIVPKHGHSSVERNRLKRRLRELGRLQILDVTGVGSQDLAVDIVMRVQPGAYQLQYEALRSEVGLLCERLRKHFRDVEARAREAAEPEAT